MADGTPVKVENDKSAVKLQYANTEPTEDTGAHLVDLDGVFETVGATPTGSPRDVYGQVKINSANGSICFYDAKNSAWLCIGAETTYGGRVRNNAADTPFPTGWSLNNTGTGVYVITHNLGTASFAIAVTADSTQTRAIDIVSRSTTTFVLEFKNSSGTSVDTDFDFIIKIQE